MPEARLFTRALHIHSVIYEVEQYLHVALGLHIAAHNPKTDPGLAVAKYHRRHQRVEWAFAAFEPVWMIGIEGKAGAPIVQHNARIPSYQARSESAEDALNKRNHVAVLVHHGQVDGVFTATRT